MPFEITDFHFLRPYFLLLLIPAAALIYLVKQKSSQQSTWQSVISPHLLKFLFVSAEKQNTLRFPTWLMAILFAVIILALSGPSFRQKPVPVFETESAQVILMDLSLSMDATDLRPSRLERAKFKLLDLLNQTKEGTIALVVYAGDAFVVSPLTSDANTIASMVPTLSTGIMPVLGSRPDLGIAKAVELLKNARQSQGQIIWLTDGVEDFHVSTIVDKVKGSGYQLSILAIGSKEGAPIPLPNGNGFLKDESGAIVVPKLESKALIQIANQLEAGFVKLSADPSDLEYLKAHWQWQAENSDKAENKDQKISKWIDDGYWLVWLALVLFLLKIVRQPSGSFLNWLTPLILLTLLTGIQASEVKAAVSNKVTDETEATQAEKNVSPTPGVSETTPFTEEVTQFWNDLWATRDQQGQSAFRQGDYQKSAELFENKDWRATANFRSGEFADAASEFDGEDVRSMYNRATSLAKAQKLQESLDTYNKLLEKAPEHEDALFNKKIVEELLKQQQQQQNQDQQNQDQNQNQDQKNQDQSQDSKSQQQDQNKDQENAEQNKQQQDAQQQESEQDKQAEQKKQDVEVSEDQRDKSEKDQALEHWLEKIPDDPGGLLRRKMYREYQKRGREQKEEKYW